MRFCVFFFYFIKLSLLVDNSFYLQLFVIDGLETAYVNHSFRNTCLDLSSVVQRKSRSGGIIFHRPKRRCLSENWDTPKEGEWR